MIDALRIIAARSPVAGEQAIQCIKAVQVKSPVVAERYNNVVRLAFGDPQATFTAKERELIAEHIGDGALSSGRSRIIRFRVSIEEARDINQMAEDAGQSLSDFIRSRIWPA